MELVSAENISTYLGMLANLGAGFVTDKSRKLDCFRNTFSVSQSRGQP